MRPETTVDGTPASTSPEPKRTGSREAGDRLRRLRTSGGLSQAELAHRVGVSQRHLSCIETGRSQPSRAMLLALLEALQTPLNERNVLLLAAGLAPEYSERALTAAELTPVRSAIEHLLAAHDPAPAFLLDAQWNLLRANRGARRLVDLLGLPPGLLDGPLNMLRAALSPGGFGDLCANRAELVREIWSRASREAVHVPGLADLLEELRPYAPEQHFGRDKAASAASSGMPVLMTRLRAGSSTLTFLSTFTSFGAPLDVTVASLRIEHLFPADELTREALAATEP